MKSHIGHTVEIEGGLKGDLKEGEIAVERKGNWTEVTVKAEGRKHIHLLFGACEVLNRPGRSVGTRQGRRP